MADVYGLSTQRELPPLPVVTGCEHPDRVLAVRETNNGSKQFRIQCRVCGATSQNIAHSALYPVERAAAVPLDPSLRGAFRAEHEGASPPPAGWQIVHRDTDDPPLGMTSYEVYTYYFVIAWLRRAEDRGLWRLLPVWAGDIDEPVFRR